ncbi:hypothetical protein AWN90_16210 [Nocardia terpenica]|uniref:YjeF C-terminal domain-containing protein n=1 Tax=Nocardia terpenica TaxID=455432 RepID=A0A161Z9S3_9NOCA|nr:NAD(P)H-hydrate dehydratase [Nocardia terpenica]KZM75882.1 hypothetical protein AWN90_16210 [Nocardia terpenica]
MLTPHAGEFARLTGHDPGPDRVAAVRKLAEEWQLTVLLKGRATLVASPGHPVLVNEAGGSWAATAGAAQVLAHFPEVIAAESISATGRVQCWVFGPGAPISATPLLHHLRPAVQTLRIYAGAAQP